MNAVLSVTMDMAIRLVDGEVGALMTEESGELQTQVSWGVGDQFVKSLMYEDELDLPTYCFQKRETIILTDLEVKSDEGITLDTVMATPIQTRDKCLGVAIIINKANGGNYTPEDKEALEMLLNFVAVAVENSRLIKDKLRQQKIDQEMAIARQVQETILPATVEIVKGAQVGAVYFPAREVGGDFYDIVPVDDNRYYVIIGDVSNKGVPAALVMSACSGIISSILEQEPQIAVSELAGRVNQLMVDHVIKDREMFVTLFFSCFDMEARKLTYCNGGHMPGLFWSDELQKIIELAEGGPIVGQFGDMVFKEGEQRIASGDRLFLYTDGLTEAMDADGNLFGRERAEQVLSAEIGLNPKEFCLRVKEWVDRFAQGAAEDTHDDFTIVQVRVD